jgi:hypothetical protein
MGVTYSGYPVSRLDPAPVDCLLNTLSCSAPVLSYPAGAMGLTVAMGQMQTLLSAASRLDRLMDYEPSRDDACDYDVSGVCWTCQG